MSSDEIWFPAHKRPLPKSAEVDAIAGKGSRIRSVDFARRLGVNSRTIRRAYQRGAFPGAVEHGPKLLFIPIRYLRLAQAYGLLQVERMAHAGFFAANSVDLTRPRLHGRSRP